MNDPLPSHLSNTPPAQLNIGAPMGISDAAEPLVFNYIPRLRHLLPKFRGWPGYVYAQVAVQNKKRAQSEGWSPVADTYVYTIEGPKGRVDMELLVRGKRIRGQSHESGRRVLKCDTLVEQVTGLKIQEGSPDGEVEITQEASESVEIKPESSKGPSGGPQPNQSSSSGKSSRDPQKSKG